jgi:hypothetical protein
MRFVGEWGPRLMWLGAFAALGAAGYLLYAALGLSSGSAGQFTQQDVERLQSALGTAGYVLIAGLVVLSVGVLLLYLEEGATGPFLLLLAALLYWGVPMFVLMTTRTGAGSSQALFDLALTKIRVSAIAVLTPAVLQIVYLLLSRARLRGTVGVRADQLKFGKGVKEEPEIVNRFLGKCWQLPYCRKFIRLRCPIYYSRRTCWRERVGCMCEEKVIRNAMEGTVRIPKDPQAAEQYIPYNKKLTAAEKAERCRACVIYNEHQRQKYRLMVPILLLLTVGPVVAWHDRCKVIVGDLLATVDGALSRFSIHAAGSGHSETLLQSFQGSPTAVEILLVSLIVIVLAYLLRIVEYALFRLKI